jgi:hypothetical protein
LVIHILQEPFKKKYFKVLVLSIFTYLCLPKKIAVLLGFFQGVLLSQVQAGQFTEYPVEKGFTFNKLISPLDINAEVAQLVEQLICNQ